MNQEEHCRVLYDFKADGNNELSVTKGEIVKLISAHGEWMMVEKVSKPFQKGFVPTLYITIIKNSTSDNSKESTMTSFNQDAREEKRKSKQSHTTSSNNNSTSNVGSIPSTNKNDKPVEIQPRIQHSPSKQQTPPSFSQSVTPTISTSQELPSKNTTEEKNNLSKLNVTRRTSSSTPSYTKNSQKGYVQQQPFSGFVTKVVADYEESVALMQSYETNEKIFKQTLVQREEAFKSIEQKLEKISKDVLDFQTTNDQLIDKIRRLELRIENDRSNLINNYSTDTSGITESSERKRNSSRNFQSSSKN